MRTLALSALALSALALSASSACQPAPIELTEDQRAEIAETVTQISAEMQAAYVNEDLSYFDYYAEWPRESTAGRRSWTASERSVAGNWAANDQVTEYGEVRSLVLSADQVVVQRALINTVTNSDGEVVSYDAMLTELWVREAGTWKVLIYNFEQLPAG